jgi:hypothetical protein
MKVEVSGANKYTLDLGSATPETVVADGTDQPTLDGTTLSITVEGPDTWKVVRKKDGRTLLTAIWKLSQDGKTLRDALTANKANGSTFSLDYVYKRTAGSAGFPGTWESTSEEVNSVFEIEIRPYEEDGLSLVIPAQNSTKNVRLDGKDYPNQVPDSASSARRVNERTLEMTDKKNGKISRTQQFKVSPDLNTLTIVQSVGQNKASILVFDRE